MTRCCMRWRNFWQAENLSSIQAQTLEDTLVRRALVTAMPKAVWHGGKQVGTELIYDNRLLEKALKVYDKRYAEDSGAARTALLQFQNMSIEDLREEIARLDDQINAGEHAKVISGDAVDATPEPGPLPMKQVEADAPGKPDWEL